MEQHARHLRDDEALDPDDAHRRRGRQNILQHWPGRWHPPMAAYAAAKQPASAKPPRSATPKPDRSFQGQTGQPLSHPAVRLGQSGAVEAALSPLISAVAAAIAIRYSGIPEHHRRWPRCPLPHPYPRQAGLCVSRHAVLIVLKPNKPGHRQLEPSKQMRRSQVELGKPDATLPRDPLDSDLA
jgi:hypothetical protein